jgi:hypothetical protein
MDVGIMEFEDVKKLIGLYKDSISIGQIKDPNGGIDKMTAAFDVAK